MKLLDGRELSGFIQTRHSQIVRSLPFTPKLIILYCGDELATQKYLKAKINYGSDIGVDVVSEQVDPQELLKIIKKYNHDKTVGGIIVQLPLPSQKLTDEVLKTIDIAKDVDGLCSKTSFQAATPKGIIWLLAGYNVDLKGEIAVVGQGRLVGKPLADSFESSGYNIKRYDDKTDDLKSELLSADVIISATGQVGLITNDMIKFNAVVVDTGSPKSELADDVRERSDLTITPNPGGVGPMTVAALFDNLLIATNKKIDPVGLF